MKNKLFIVLAIIALVAIVVALDYGDAQAVAMGKASPAVDRARAGCRLRCTNCDPPHSDFDWDDVSAPPNPIAEAFAQCDCTPWGVIKSHAFAEYTPPGVWEAWVAEDAWWNPLCCQVAWGKGDGDKGPVEEYDTLHAIIVKPDNYYTVNLTGYSKLNKYYEKPLDGWRTVEFRDAAGNLISHADYRLVQSASVDWRDHIRRSGKLAEGAVENWFTGGVYTPGESLRVVLNATFEIPGKIANPDSLALDVSFKGSQYAQLPTTSETGLIILMVALVGTGVGLIWWRKRRKAVAVV
jgi:hypothetical protein